MWHFLVEINLQELFLIRFYYQGGPQGTPPCFATSTVLHVIISKQDIQINKGNNKITELRTILQRESQNS